MEEQDIVWNAITESAKRKFNFNEFSKDFNSIDETFAEDILFKTIISFAGDKTIEEISGELFNQILLSGFHWDMKDIKTFLADKKELLKMEVFVSQIAFNLLEDGNQPFLVLNQIQPMLN